MGRPRIHQPRPGESASAARNRAARAKLSEGGGRQINVWLSAEEAARLDEAKRLFGFTTDREALTVALTDMVERHKG